MNNSVQRVLSADHDRLVPQIDKLTEQAWDALVNHLTDPAREIALQVLELVSTISPSYAKGLADALVISAHYHRLQGEQGLALSQALEAKAIYDSYHYRDVWLARALYTLGISHFLLGDYTRSLELHLDQLTLAQKVDDSFTQAAALRRIGVLHVRRGDYERGLAYYAQSRQIYEQMGWLEGIAAVFTNCSVTYQHLNQWEQALELSLKSVKLYEQTEAPAGLAQAHSTLGTIYLELGKQQEAAEHLQQAVECAQQSKQTRLELAMLRDMGIFYCASGAYEDAERTLQHVLKRAQASEDLDLQCGCCKALSEVYEAQDNIAEAFAYFKQYHQLVGKYQQESSRARFDNLEIVHHTKQALAEAETQRRLRESDRRYFEKLSRMKDEYMSSASHDLKNPLSSIILIVSLLKRHGRTDDTRGLELLQRVTDTVAKMHHLVTNLLDLAKLETGKALKVGRHDLIAFIQEIVDHFSLAAQNEGKKLTLHSRASSLMVAFDEDQLHQVLNNLFSNALKYTRQGDHISIFIDQHQHKARVRIVDTGIGIPTEDLPHIFERFYRVDHQSHHAVEGTGLGLAICQSIIEQHKGEIWAESEIGHGTTLTFTLPLHL